MKYEKPWFYIGWKHKNKYVGIRFKDPVKLYTGAWKIKPFYIKKLLRVYDGVTCVKELDKIESELFKNKVNRNKVRHSARLLQEYFKRHYAEVCGKELNIYTIERLIMYYDKWKAWKFFGRPMVSADDFIADRYFEEYKEAFNNHNKNKFIIW